MMPQPGTYLWGLLGHKDDCVGCQQRPRALVKECHLHIRTNACMPTPILAHDGTFLRAQLLLCDGCICLHWIDKAQAEQNAKDMH